MEILVSHPLPLLRGLVKVEGEELTWTGKWAFGKEGHAGDGGQATAALIDNPFGVVRGPDGALYFCEYDGECVRRVADDGTISTIAVRNMPGTPPRATV